MNNKIMDDYVNRINDHKLCIECVHHSEQIDLFGDEFNEHTCHYDFSKTNLMHNFNDEEIKKCQNARTVCRGLYFKPRKRLDYERNKV